MSSKKRRKIRSKPTSGYIDNKKERLKEFREKLLVKFVGEQYCFLEEYISTIATKEYLRKRFCDISNDDKIRRILYYDERGKKALKEKLCGVDCKRLKRLYFETFGKKFFPSKETMCQILSDKFFGNDSEYFKRENEKSNLIEVGKASMMRDLQSLYVKGVFINRDILMHIFSYCQYDRNLLFETGRVSKAFYLTILCSWPKISIQNCSLYGISLLVLQNVREIRIVENKSSQRFLASELNFLLNNLGINLRRIVFRCSLVALKSYFQIIQKHIKTKKKKNHHTRIRRNPLRFVTEIKLSIIGRNTTGTFKRILKMSSWRNNVPPLSSLFPSLTSFQHPLYLPILLDTKKNLESLKLKILPPKYSQNLCRSNARDESQEIINRLYSIDRIRKNVPKSIRNLNLTKEVDPLLFPKDEFLFSLFERLRELETLDLKLSFCWKKKKIKRSHTKKIFDLSFLSTYLSTTLRELKISNYNHQYIMGHCEIHWVDGILSCDRPFSCDFFTSTKHIEKMRSLRILTIFSKNLLRPRGVWNILERLTWIKKLRVLCMCGEEDDFFSPMISSIPKVENVHLEIQVVGKPELGNNIWEIRDFLKFYRDHLIIVDRNEKKKKIEIGFLTLCGIRRFKKKKKKKNIGFGCIWMELEIDKYNNEDGEYKTIFQTVDHVTNNLGLLLRSSKKEKNIMIQSVDVICKESEKDRILDWSVFEEGYKRKSNNREEYDKISDWSINRKRKKGTYVGEVSRTGPSTSDKKMERFVVQTYYVF